jgi:hypothetical protein
MIAIYIDSDLSEYYDKVVATTDFIFKTLGYEYRYIQSVDEFLDTDVILFYSNLEMSITYAEYIAFDKVLIQIPVEETLWQIGAYGYMTIRSLIKKVKVENLVLPFLAEKNIEEIAFMEDSQHCRMVKLNIDIIANIFVHLIAYYDIMKCYDDKIPDSPFEDYNMHPYVNYFLFLLDQTLETVYNNTDYYPAIKKDFWPGGQNFAVTISHSVDKLYKWPTKKILRSFFDDLFVIHHIKYFWQNLISKLKAIFTNREEYWTFDEICELENKYHIKSTYFWGADIPQENPFDYDLEDTDVEQMILEQSKKGFDVQLLASKYSAKSDLIVSQKARLKKLLEKPILGSRIQDYKFDVQKTPRFYKKHNIFFDSSYVLENKCGFKNGIAFPYEFLYLDFSDKTKLPQINRVGTIQIPVAFKDKNLQLNKFKTLSYELATKQIDELFKTIKKTNGVLGFDFSTSNFADIKYLLKLFEYLLRKILKNNPYVTTFSELAIWWKKRNAVHITEHEGYFTIYFPEELKQFSFHIYKENLNEIKIEGADFRQDSKDKRHFILRNISRNSRVYVIFE